MELIKKPWEWNEEDLKNYIKIGWEENIRLEFKDSRIFQQNENKYKQKILQEISAFANSEGGVLVIGIKEGPSHIRKKSIAVDIDEGVDSNVISRDRLNEIINSNISPPLAGIRINSITLSNNDGRVAYAIFVPQGSTAHQSNIDKLYYIRDELRSTAMNDHQIRVRMMRGQIPQAKIELATMNFFDAIKDFNDKMEVITRNKELANKEDFVDVLMKRPPKPQFNKLYFQLKVVNSGEVTLKDFLLEVDMDTNIGYSYPNANVEKIDNKNYYRFIKTTVIMKDEFRRRIEPEDKLFPHQEIYFPEDKWFLEIPIDMDKQIAYCLLKWTLYLDNTLPIIGELDILGEFLAKTPAK